MTNIDTTIDTTIEGLLATRDEMSYPDWEQRLGRAQRESRQGKVVSLERYLARRALR